MANNYKHGIYPREVATSIVAPVVSECGLPVVFGTAPVHLTENPEAAINKPILCNSYAEAVKALGYSNDWGKYTLCEFMYSQFSLYNTAPVVFVNVLDPSVHGEHKTSVTAQEFTLADGQCDLGADVLINTVSIAALTEGDTAPVLDTDYSVNLDSNNHAIFTAIDGGKLASATTATVSFDRVNASGVTADDIIGGIDASTGAKTGLELISEVYPKFTKVPGLIVAPGWSHDSGVASVMRAKAEEINGVFSAVAVCDLPCNGEQAYYTNVPEWKDEHSIGGEYQIACWPKVALDGKVFHLSTHLVGLMNKTDAREGDNPSKSPSNELLSIDSCVDATGKEISLGLESANYLNGCGIVTALNWTGGWKAWGNRTACYPSNTDPKDNQIPIRRTFNWIKNTFVNTFWSKIDGKITRRFIREIVDSFNYYLNGLVADGTLLGARVEFVESENALTDLIDGVLTFHAYVTPPAPARVIEAVFEFDPTYFSTLFTA